MRGPGCPKGRRRKKKQGGQGGEELERERERERERQRQRDRERERERERQRREEEESELESEDPLDGEAEVDGCCPKLVRDFGRRVVSSRVVDGGLSDYNRAPGIHRLIDQLMWPTFSKRLPNPVMHATDAELVDLAKYMDHTLIFWAPDIFFSRYGDGV